MSLFNNKRKEVWAIVAFLVILFAAFATTCRSAEVQMSYGNTILRGSTQVLDLTVIMPKVVKDADVQCGITLVGSSVQKYQEQRNQAGLHCSLVDGFGKLDVGVGVAVLQNVDIYNSGKFNFRLGLGYRATRHLGFTYNHWSNAGTTKPNVGRDMLLVNYRF